MRRTTIALLTTSLLVAPLVLASGACATSTTRTSDTTGGSSSDAGGSGDDDAATSGDDAGGTFDSALFGDTFAPNAQCERALDVGSLSISNSACFVNQHVENEKTKLFFPCAGGPANAVFGGHTFSGTVSGNLVSLKDVEPFIFNACQWQSTETIQGDLASGSLRYDYTEKPLAACTDTPCIASGDLEVSAGSVTVVK